MEAMASKMALGVQRKLDRLSTFPNVQGRFFMTRLCLQDMLNSASRNQGMEPSFINGAFRSTDLAVTASVAN